MSSTDGSKRATRESNPDLDYEVERLQTIPQFQSVVNDGDTDSETEPSSKEGLFDSKTRGAARSSKGRIQAGREAAMTTGKTPNWVIAEDPLGDPTPDWAVWL